MIFIMCSKLLLPLESQKTKVLSRFWKTGSSFWRQVLTANSLSMTFLPTTFSEHSSNWETRDITKYLGSLRILSHSIHILWSICVSSLAKPAKMRFSKYSLKYILPNPKGVSVPLPGFSVWKEKLFQKSSPNYLIQTRIYAEKPCCLWQTVI